MVVTGEDQIANESLSLTKPMDQGINTRVGMWWGRRSSGMKWQRCWREGVRFRLFVQWVGVDGDP